MESSSRPSEDAVVAMLGLVSLSVSLVYLRMLVRSWATSGWVGLALEGLVWLCIVGVSIAMILYPIRHIKVVNPIIQFAVWPLKLAAIAGYYYTFIAAPVITLGLVMFTPIFVWSALQVLGVVPQVAERASLYLALVATSLVFAYWGDRLTAFVILRWLQRKEDYSKLFAALRPQLVRLYIYAMMAMAYLAANVEKFSGATFTSAHWWVAYKDVLVEVLLTFVAIDSVMDIRRELKRRAGP